MASDKIIEINGQVYDARTGLPVAAPAQPAAKATRKIAVTTSKKVPVKTVAKAVKPTAKASTPAKKTAPHRPTKSRTLNRAVVKKPATKTSSVVKRPAVPKKSASKPAAPRVAVRPTPIVPRVAVRRTIPVIEKPVTTDEPTGKHHLRTALISFGALVVLIGGSLALYFFVPSVSTWVAANRASVRAVLPVYTPDGYHVVGTAESSPGQVIVNYKSGENDSGFMLIQQNSNWDSIGVLENKVKPVAKNYQTLAQKGLTIYRFNDKAIWVNGGVLYTITDGNNLSNEQILKIVESI